MIHSAATISMLTFLPRVDRVVALLAVMFVFEGAAPRGLEAWAQTAAAQPTAQQPAPPVQEDVLVLARLRGGR
jgi:hypothetical protein